ncbi:MAG: alpha/beta fold hydrolase [Gammaproteobacteria bacterium]
MLQLFAYLVGVVALGAAIAGAARAVDHPWLLLGLGLMAAVISVATVSLLPALLFRRTPKRRYAVWHGLGAGVVLLAGVALVFLRPLVPAAQQYAVEIPPGVEQWQLPTGSTLAVRKVLANPPTNKKSIVVVHGGPGAYSVVIEQTVKPLSQLSADGHDVYFYDQVGGGLSDRLDDMAEYSLDRHMRDLKALVDKILAGSGDESVILIASSWGTTLTSNYMVRHPADVYQVVFSSAAPMHHPEWREAGDGKLDEKMSDAEKTAFTDAVNQPRFMAAVLLSDINPTAASRLLPWREAGSFFDRIANEYYLSLTVCDPSAIKTQTRGFGFWSNRMTAKSLQDYADPKPALRENHTPVLIVRGECDYKKEAVARQYASTFPNAIYRSLEGAGHMVYWEKPQAFVAVVREFLGTGVVR